MRIDILTLFPEALQSYLDSSIMKRAKENDVVEINLTNIRDFSNDKNHKVDDTPYGGGPGMLMKVAPVKEAIDFVKKDNSYVISLDPKGRVFSQSIAYDLAKYENIILIAGHYEGIDERINFYVDDKISIGDYILTGGELGCLVICDSLVRLNGAINKESHEDDSFSNGLLEYPQYTKPRVFENHEVPDILLSGHHENIRKWRLKQSLFLTFKYRKDLINIKKLDDEQKKFLQEIKDEL